MRDKCFLGGGGNSINNRTVPSAHLHSLRSFSRHQLTSTQAHMADSSAISPAVAGVLFFFKVLDFSFDMFETLLNSVNLQRVYVHFLVNEAQEKSLRCFSFTTLCSIMLSAHRCEIQRVVSAHTICLVSESTRSKMI